MSVFTGHRCRHVPLHFLCSSGETGITRGTRDPQQILQQRNYLKNINPRDTVNANLRKAFLEYDKNLYAYSIVCSASTCQPVGYLQLLDLELSVKMTSKLCAKIRKWVSVRPTWMR